MLHLRPRSHPVTWLLLVVLVAACSPTAAAPVPPSVAPEQAAARASTAPAPSTTPATIAEEPPTAPRATPAPSPTDDPAASPEVVEPLEPYALNLYDRGDFVRQYTFEWCVGASLQMMVDLAGEKIDHSRARQKELWELARDRSSSPYGGANPRGWTAVLDELGVGPYRLVSVPEYDEALRVAASAIRATKRPVGLVMWRGRHAWVMSGFESMGDPRSAEAFEVTGIRVLDPLYPHGSSVWGPSPEPNSLVTPKQLARQFVARDRSRVNLGVEPGFLLVLPVEADGPAAAADPAPYLPIS